MTGGIEFTSPPTQLKKRMHMSEPKIRDVMAMQFAAALIQKGDYTNPWEIVRKACEIANAMVVVLEEEADNMVIK